MHSDLLPQQPPLILTLRHFFSSRCLLVGDEQVQLLKGIESSLLQLAFRAAPTRAPEKGWAAERQVTRTWGSVITRPTSSLSTQISSGGRLQAGGPTVPCGLRRGWEVGISELPSSDLPCRPAPGTRLGGWKLTPAGFSLTLHQSVRKSPRGLFLAPCRSHKGLF